MVDPQHNMGRSIDLCIYIYTVSRCLIDQRISYVQFGWSPTKSQQPRGCFSNLQASPHSS